MSEPLRGGVYVDGILIIPSSPRTYSTDTTNVSCSNEEYIEPTTPNFDIDKDISWHLPGTYNEPYSHCGEIKTWDHLDDPCEGMARVLLCPSHPNESARVRRNSCNRSGCPVCYKGWVFKEALSIHERILGFAKAKGYRPRFSHVVISPPQKESKELIKTRSGSKELRKKATNLIKKYGGLGGSLIFHDKREIKIKRSKDYYDKNKDNKKFFIQNTKHGKVYWEKSGIWYVSPHFHALITGFLAKSDKVYEETGWIYKNIGTREYRDFDNDEILNVQEGKYGKYDSLFLTAFYLLTHCGIAIDSDGNKLFNIPTWFGSLSYNKLVVYGKHTDFITYKCPICHGPLYECLCNIATTPEGGIKILHIERVLGIYAVRVRRREYGLPPKPKIISYEDDSRDLIDQYHLKNG